MYLHNLVSCTGYVTRIVQDQDSNSHIVHVYMYVKTYISVHFGNVRFYVGGPSQTTAAVNVDGATCI